MSRVMLGQSSICLDQNQNTVSCADPNCTFGDCGATGPQVTSGALCLDQDENAVACADPNCTYGDCIGPTTAKKSIMPATVQAATSIATASRPSPVVSVPLSTSIPGSVGLFLSSSNLIAGIPNVALIGVVGLAAVLLLGSGRKGRR